SATYTVPWTNVNLNPQLIGHSSNIFCSAISLSFSGSASGPITNTYWELTPSDSVGNPTGPPLYANWFPGAPGNFTFPISPPCGHYYKIKLAVQNNCISWLETS